MTPEQQRIALLEYQLQGLRRDMSMFALFGLVILPNLLRFVLQEFDYSRRMLVGMILALAFLYIRRKVLDVRQFRGAELQRLQEFIESAPEVIKNP